MLRHRGTRSRPENSGRSVPLQHISASDARRDARIAAGKAFALGRERPGSKTSDMFPDPSPIPAHVAGAADVAVPQHRPPTSALLQTRQSIRFVRQASPSNDYGPSNASEAVECSFSPSPSLFPDSKPGPTTPTSQRQHSIHKTWNGAMLHNKENIQGNGNTTAVETAASARLSTRSFLRAQPRRASFSFSGHDDDQLLLCGKPGEGAVVMNPSAVRLRRKSDIHLKRSLRRSRSSLGHSRPLTPNALLPKATVTAQEGPVVSEQAAEEEELGDMAAPGEGEGLPIDLTTGVGSDIAGSGMDNGTDNKGLRRTASRMSKIVKSRFRVLWGHSKSEACADELPEQHIQARRSHGSLPSGPRFCSEDSEMPYAASISASMDNSKDGMVAFSRDENGALPGAQCGGDTSRFTSWSSSVQRTSSNASHRASLNDYERQQLPVISESGDQQQKQQSYDANMSLLVSGLASSRQKQQQQQQQQQQQIDTRDVTVPSSSASSPSLAGSGRGSTPRPLIGLEALRRLQELSLDLQRACHDDDVDKGSHGQADGADANQLFGEPKKEVLYAFQSTPTTPAKAPTAALTSPTPGKESEQSSPAYFFRGKSPFRRVLRESMNSFEEQTAARRTNARGHRGGTGDEDNDDDDEPLLHPNGARQWSRVQAWQEGLKHGNSSSSSVSLSNYSQRSLAVSRSQRLEQLHSETVVTPEQMRLWTSPVQGSGRCSSPWGTRRHTRERADLGEDDVEGRL